MGGGDSDTGHRVGKLYSEKLVGSIVGPRVTATNSVKVCTATQFLRRIDSYAKQNNI